MGCEVGSIKGRFTSKQQAECFVEQFNRIMEEKEEFFEEDHRISMDDMSKYNRAYSCELDIWGRFADTYQTWLQFVAAELIKNLPDKNFKITYNRDWDNSSESYYEEYDYANGKLAAKSMEEDCSYCDDDYYDDDEDFDEEDEDDTDDYEEDEDEFVSEILFEKEWLFEYADGKFKQLSGEPSKVFSQALELDE